VDSQNVERQKEYKLSNIIDIERENSNAQRNRITALKKSLSNLLHAQRNGDFHDLANSMEEAEATLESVEQMNPYHNDTVDLRVRKLVNKKII